MILHDPPDDSPMATDVPCVVELSIGAGAEIRVYGPFENLIAAREWCDRQVPQHFKIVPLRRTNKSREHLDDWYGPDSRVADEFCETVN